VPPIEVRQRLKVSDVLPLLRVLPVVGILLWGQILSTKKKALLLLNYARIICRWLFVSAAVVVVIEVVLSFAGVVDVDRVAFTLIVSAAVIGYPGYLFLKWLMRICNTDSEMWGSLSKRIILAVKSKAVNSNK
jgi:hypothetical protein